MSFNLFHNRTRANKHPLALVVAFAMVTFFTGCGGDAEPHTLITNTSSSLFVSGSNVYVSGVLLRHKYFPIEDILLWKNGVINFQTNNGNGIANSVFASDTDVYIAGQSLKTGRAVLWTNGVPQYFDTEEGRIDSFNSVFVLNGDVYVAGTIQRNGYSYIQAILMKNGVLQYLTDGDDARATSVFVSGDDTYVAGYKTIQNGNRNFRVAAIWKNGNVQYIGGDGYSNTSAHSIFVSDNDVFVAGVANDTGVLWKNGVPQFITAKGDGNYAASVFVSDGDVYVAGTTINYPSASASATLWKNGDRQDLTYKNKATSANSVFVSNGDVYVAGNTDTTAVIWKNGVAQEMQFIEGN